MSVLTVLFVDQSQLVLDIDDDVLVFDGQEFVRPIDAKYLALYDMPVSAKTIAYRDIVNAVFTSQYVNAKVLNFDPVPRAFTAPQVVAAPNPSLECVCFVTCRGSLLAFVNVTQEP